MQIKNILKKQLMNNNYMNKNIKKNKLIHNKENHLISKRKKLKKYN